MSKKSKTLGASLLLLSSLLLAACGSETATSTTGTTAGATTAGTTAATTTTTSAATTTSATTTAATTSVAATTAVATTSAATTSATTTGATTSAATTRISNGTATSPAIAVADTANLQVGKTVNLTGQGFPANGWVNVYLAAQGTDPASLGTTSLALADAKGNFSTVLILSAYGDGSKLKPGKNTILVATQDKAIKATTTVDIVGGATS